MTIATALPEVWTAGQALATRALLQQALLTATPIIAFIPEPTLRAEQLQELYDRVKALIREGAHGITRNGSRWHVTRQPWPRSP